MQKKYEFLNAFYEDYYVQKDTNLNIFNIKTFHFCYNFVVMLE